MKEIYYDYALSSFELYTNIAPTPETYKDLSKSDKNIPLLNDFEAIEVMFNEMKVKNSLMYSVVREVYFKTNKLTKDHIKKTSLDLSKKYDVDIKKIYKFLGGARLMFAYRRGLRIAKIKGGNE